MTTLSWLLDSDPSIRWQVMRHLTDEPEEVVSAERAKVATQGWGARLLELQRQDGRWEDGTGVPGRESTLYTLMLLMAMGLDPTSDGARTAIGRVRQRITWGPEFGDAPFMAGEVEPCINGAVLASGSYFGEPSDRLVDRLLDEQLEDGGWNCDAPPSRRSSFHSTICVLEGLWEYEQVAGSRPAVTDSRARAEDYLMERGMFRRLSTGDVIDRTWTRSSFPSGWHYDVLRGLDYLADTDVKPDERVTEAVELLVERRHQNLRWPAGEPHGVPLPLSVESNRGTASHWNTLRAMRVLDWAGHT